MKLTNVKATVTKLMTAGMLAGAVMLAGPAKANAEVVVRVGSPFFGRPGYYERMRIEEARRHAEWVRAHERDRFCFGFRR
jgi:hypothetical protein